METHKTLNEKVLKKLKNAFRFVHILWIVTEKAINCTTASPCSESTATTNPYPLPGCPCFLSPNLNLAFKGL